MNRICFLCMASACGGGGGEICQAFKAIASGPILHHHRV